MCKSRLRLVPHYKQCINLIPRDPSRGVFYETDHIVATARRNDLFPTENSFQFKAQRSAMVDGSATQCNVVRLRGRKLGTKPLSNGNLSLRE
jgi:hypothetical protein